MANIELRINLQRSRFKLIEEAADFNETESLLSSRPLLQTRLNMLDQNWSKFQAEHEILCHSHGDLLTEHLYLKERLFERCQAFYVYSRARILTLLEEIETLAMPSSSEHSEKETPSSLLPRSALPRIKLPNFSGEYKSWRSFHDLFKSMIFFNTELSNVEKMHYLKTCLSGEAAKLVSNLSASGENFSVAWTLLTSRYENKRFLITTQLDRIFNLKPLKTKNAKGLRSLQTTILEALGALGALDCAVQSWDPLLLHLLTRLLDPDTREAWEVEIGPSNTYPTMAQFEEFLGGRVRALEHLQSSAESGKSKELQRSTTQFSHRLNTRNIAHAIASNSVPSTSSCILCKEAHFFLKCDRYRSLNANQRKELIMKHRKCFNCLGAHTVNQCRVTKRCLVCGRRHHTSLHTNTFVASKGKNLTADSEQSSSTTD
ncbi:uncharacterized protein [Cardiocondyla obscurior]|uniref:uncharacterized protein n=1 Tax=Cardiocondyla obscurior TaxID=286306 RepID=UPI0039658C47